MKKILGFELMKILFRLEVEEVILRPGVNVLLFPMAGQCLTSFSTLSADIYYVSNDQ